MKRRCTLLLAALPGLALGWQSALPVPASLQDSAALAVARGDPLVLVVSLANLSERQAEKTSQFQRPSIKRRSSIRKMEDPRSADSAVF